MGGNGVNKTKQKCFSVVGDVTPKTIPVIVTAGGRGSGHHLLFPARLLPPPPTTITKRPVKTAKNTTDRNQRPQKARKGNNRGIRTAKPDELHAPVSPRSGDEGVGHLKERKLKGLLFFGE